MWGRRLQVVVDYNVAALTLHIRSGEIQLLCVPLPAHGQHDGLSSELADLAFERVEQV